MLWSLSIYASPACWYPVCCSLILVFPIDNTACQPPSPEAFSVRLSVSLSMFFFIKFVRFIMFNFRAYFMRKDIIALWTNSILMLCLVC